MRPESVRYERVSRGLPHCGLTSVYLLTSRPNAQQVAALGGAAASSDRDMPPAHPTAPTDEVSSLIRDPCRLPLCPPSSLPSGCGACPLPSKLYTPIVNDQHWTLTPKPPTQVGSSIVLPNAGPKTLPSTLPPSSTHNPTPKPLNPTHSIQAAASSSGGQVPPKPKIKTFEWNSWEMKKVAKLLPVDVLQHYLIYQDKDTGAPCDCSIVDQFLEGESWTMEEFSSKILGYTYSQLFAERARCYTSFCKNAGTVPDPFYGEPYEYSFFRHPSAALLTGWVQSAQDVRNVCAAHMFSYTISTVPFLPARCRETSSPPHHPPSEPPSRSL